MVFEYLEYDLTGILETPEIRFSVDHLKSWSQQLLAGVHYMHKNKVGFDIGACGDALLPSLLLVALILVFLLLY